MFKPDVNSALRVDDGFLYNNPTSLQITQNLDYLPVTCPEPSRRSERNSADSGVSSHEFTGKACPERSRREQDPETALAHTLFRQHSSNLGRWMTPDPAGHRAVSPANPQTWNRYSYVLNNPLALIDPLGLSCVTVARVDDDGNLDTSIADDGDGLGCADAGGGAVPPDGPEGQEGLARPQQLEFNFDADPFAGTLSDTFSFDFGSTVADLSLGSNDPCSNATLSATGMSIRQQLTAVKVATTFPAHAYNPASTLMFGLVQCASLVKTGAPFDVKNQPGPGTYQQRVDAGNIAFGVSCPFGAQFCQLAAGLAQTLALDPNFKGTLLTGFDTPSDNASIRIGQAMRAAGCHE